MRTLLRGRMAKACGDDYSVSLRFSRSWCRTGIEAMCEETRRQAYDAMLDGAREMGANAIVGVRYDASEVVSRESATEVLCYGTAVVVARL